MNSTVIFILSVIFIAGNIRNLPALPLTSIDCPLPKAGRIRDLTSIKIVVREYRQGMSNMYTYGIKLKEKTTHTLYNNGTIYDLRNGAKAVFDGSQVCISAKKISILDQSGSNEIVLQQCDLRCFGTNETIVQVTRIEEGGILLAKKIRGLCCVWSSETWLEISTQKPSYKCLSCSGDECQNNLTRFTQCNPGKGCFSMVFTMKQANKTTSYRMKGCTNHRILYGRGCWNGCRKMSVNYDMCIECCFGNGCNVDKEENSTKIPTKVPSKMWRVGISNESNRNSCTRGLLLSVFILIWFVSIS